MRKDKKLRYAEKYMTGGQKVRKKRGKNMIRRRGREDERAREGEEEHIYGDTHPPVSFSY